MKGNILLISFMLLTFAVFLAFSHTLSFALYEPAFIMEARAEGSTYRLAESQEEGQWYAQMEEDPNEEVSESFNPYPESEEEDVFRYMPYDIDPETEEDSSEDTESRR